MKIAVIGAGAIGSVLGCLLARAGEDVTLVGRRAHVDAVNQSGLLLDGALGEMRVRVKAQERLDFTPEVALLTAKTQAVATTARQVHTVPEFQWSPCKTACAVTSWLLVCSARRTS
jgi:2-dehydropantoate 2-reductase